jgi:hypothetical protein
MGTLTIQHRLEKVAKDLVRQIIVVGIASGDDLIRVPTILGQPAGIPHQRFSYLRIVLGIELDTPYQPVAQTICLNTAELRRGQKYGLLRQPGDLIAMP